MKPDTTRHEFWKLTVLLVATGFTCVFLLETGVRAIFAAKVGPHVMFYGIAPSAEERNVMVHGNIVQGRYSKYMPHETRLDTDVMGMSYEVVMNRHGFRGKDYSYEKPPGVIRVVTLGASSTFGYHSRDNETYPSMMEGFLNMDCDAQKFEVINLGIPHLDSRQILALLQDEAFRLSPDVVTLYEGVNDSGGGNWRAPNSPSLSQKLKTFIRKHFLTAKLIRDLLDREKQYTAATTQSERNNVSVEFLANLQLILNAARSRNITLVVATQQAKSSLFGTETIRGVTYAHEVKTIRSMLSEHGKVGQAEGILLIHSELMDLMRRWASENSVPLVDVIEALDQRRDTLMSWVHLSPEGNKIAARAFADQILKTHCR